MLKRGQITTFIIIGIVIVLVFAFLFFARDTLIDKFSSSVNVEKQVNQKMSEIASAVEECIAEEGNRQIKDYIFGNSEPESYFLYHTEKIKVLCEGMPNSDKCIASPLVISVIEKELAEKLNENIYGCIISEVNSKTFDVKFGESATDVKIDEENVLISVQLPVSVSKNDFKLNRDIFSKRIDVKLKKIINGVNDILKSEALSGQFDMTGYNKNNINGIIVNELQVNGGNRAYEVYISDDMKFRFGVRDEA